LDESISNAVSSPSTSLYGLKQALCAWFNHFAQFAASIIFHPTQSDCSLFVYQQGGRLAYLLLYVDDMILTASTTGLLHTIINKIKSEFKIKDMGPLKSFLGVQIQRSSTGFFLSQEHYTKDLIDRAGMAGYKPALTPVDTNGKLPASTGEALDNPSEYQSLVGVLHYLTITRPNISYVVQQACLHMNDRRGCHLVLIKKILRYVRGTSSLGLHLHASSH
jgi:hypothetical protein